TNQVALAWSAPPGGAGSYNVYRGTATGVTRFAGADAGSTTSTTFTNTGLSNGTPYFFVVTAVNDAGESAESFEVTATPGSSWTVQFGTTVADSVAGVGVDTSGNIFAYGQTDGTLDGTNAGGTDIFIRKYKPDGGFTWGVQRGTSANDTAAAYSAAVDPTGHVMVAGHTTGILVSGEDAGKVFLLKYDSSGTMVWERQFRGTGTAAESDAPRGVTVDSVGDIYIAGFSAGGIDGVASAGGNNDPMLVKYSSAGARQWTRLIGTSGSNEYAYSVAVASNGDPVITGFTTGNLVGGAYAGQADIFVARFDSSGTEKWRRQYGTTTYDYGVGIAIAGVAGDIYVSGMTLGGLNGQTNLGGWDAVLLRLDSDGGHVWTRQYGSSANDYGGSVVTNAVDSIFVGGRTDGNLDAGGVGGGTDVYVARFDTDGGIVWIRQSGTSLNEDGPGIALDPFGFLYVGGNTYGGLDGNLHQGSTSFSDAFIMKFSTGGVKQ
ncbi:MAG: SBBP repeat-containing protein, partial [Deltaproteobacteria bacterium]|nr:SBBP repeat-containing protein [Deltaproteobacteria bacterium]